MEQWKRVVINGEPWDYEVSNLGNVKRIGSSKCLKPSCNHGYLQVILCKNGNTKKMFVHRLVATAFIPNPNNLSDVNHKNEIKTDNALTNLEWMTHEDNIRYSRSKKVICLDTKQIFGSLRDAEKWCGKTGVKYCCKGKTRTCGGYHWQYLDDYKREQRKQSDINNSRLAA